MAKALIDGHGCRVIGVVIARCVTCDAALPIWVLQHCPKLAEDTARTARALGLAALSSS